MKKLFVTLSLFCWSINLTPNEHVCFYLPQPMVINYYAPLIQAIINYESKGNIYAFNFLEQACGPMQIRPCRLTHYNKLTGNNYTSADCFSVEVSRKIFLFFTKGRSYETVAKSWNGSGVMTIAYWDSIQVRL